MNGAQTSMLIGVGWERLVVGTDNPGTVYEFFLVDGDGNKLTNDEGVLRTVKTGDSLKAHALAVLRQVILGQHQHRYYDSCHRGSHHALTEGPRE